MASKSSLVKTLAGCGCVVLIVGAILLGGAAYLTMKGVEKLQKVAAEQTKEFNPDKLRELLPQDLDMPQVDQTKVIDALGRPLEAADVDRFLAANAWFYEQPENARVAKAIEGISKQDQGLGIFVNAQDAMESHKDLVDLLVRFNGYVGENGGYATQIDSAIRTAGVVAAADVLGRVKGGDAWSDQSATELRELASKIDGKADVDSLAKTLRVKPEDISWAKPGLVAFTKMPNKSFETWEDLPASKRKEVVEAYRKQGSAALSTQLNPILKTGGLLEILARGLK